MGIPWGATGTLSAGKAGMRWKGWQQALKWEQGCCTSVSLKCGMAACLTKISSLLQQRKGGPTRLTLPSKSTVSESCQQKSKLCLSVFKHLIYVCHVAQWFWAVEWGAIPLVLSTQLEFTQLRAHFCSWVCAAVSNTSKQAVTFIVLLRFGMAALGTEFCIAKASFTMSSSGF